MADDFEKFLTHDAYKKYSLSYLGYRWLKTEIEASGEKFSTQLGKDMVHFEYLRQDINHSLSKNPDERMASATKWSTYLKPRIERLDLWSTIFTAFGAFMAAGLIILSLIWQHKQGTSDYFFIFSGAVIAFFVAGKKLEIDRRKSWYKYLTSHLEAIKLQSS